MKLSDLLNQAELAGVKPNNYYEGLFFIQAGTRIINADVTNDEHIVKCLLGCIYLLDKHQKLSAPKSSVDEYVTDLIAKLRPNLKFYDESESTKPITETTTVSTETIPTGYAAATVAGTGYAAAVTEPSLESSVTEEKVEEKTEDATHTEYAGEMDGDGTIKTLIGFIYPDNTEFLPITVDDIAGVISKYGLDGKVAYDKDSGLIKNLGLAGEFFQAARFSMVKSKKMSYLEMFGYKNPDENKNFGTPRMDVRIYDTAILNKMQNKDTVIVSGLDNDLTVGKTLELSSHYLLFREGEADKPFAMLSVLELEKK